MTKTRFLSAVALTLAAGFAHEAVFAQQTGIARTEVQRHDLSLPGREVVQVRVDFEPGVAFPRHRHPGEETAYVLEGTVEYRFDGQAPVTLKAGESLFIPAGTVHTAKNVGTDKASELATYVIEKGRPPVEQVQ
jgi:quercetin dioxygenase-like cupin family protein